MRSLDFGVPLPDGRVISWHPVARRGRGRPPEYPFDRMEPGDSFCAGPLDARRRDAVRKAISSWRSRQGSGKEEFVVAADPDSIEHLRVWRTA